MFNLINEKLLEKKENAKKAEAALNDINKICAKYADKDTRLKYACDSDQAEQLAVLSAYLLFLTAQTDKNVSFQDLVEKKVFVDLDFRRKCKINYEKYLLEDDAYPKFNDGCIKRIEEYDDDFSGISYRKKPRTEKHFQFSRKHFDRKLFEESRFFSEKYEDSFDPYISADVCFKKGVTLSNTVRDNMNEELWDHLKNLLKKYPAEIFKEVALCTTKAETLNANEMIAAIVKILEIKEDDTFLIDGSLNSSTFMSFYHLNKKTRYAVNTLFENNAPPETDYLVRGALLPENVRIWHKVWMEKQPLFEEGNFDKIIFWGYDAYGFGPYKDSSLLPDNPLEVGIVDDDAVGIVRKTAKKFGIDEQALSGADIQCLFDYCNLLEKIELLKKAKKAICQFPNEALYAKSYEPFRRILIENGLVESVLGEKENSFLVLSNGNTEVSFYKAYDNFFRFSFDKNDKRETAANADILGNDANLYFEAYLNDDDYLKNAVTLGSLTKKSFRGVSCTAEDLKNFGSDYVKNKRFLKYSDIKDGIISNDMQSLLQIDEKYKKYCAKEGDLIISKICSPFKVAVIEGNAREVLVGDNLYVIRLDDKKVEPFCVKAFLESSKGQRQVEKLLSGKKLRALSLQDVLNLKIELKDKNAQYAIANEYKDSLHKIKNAQALISQKIEELSHLWDR